MCEPETLIPERDNVSQFIGSKNEMSPFLDGAVCIERLPFVNISKPGGKLVFLDNELVGFFFLSQLTEALLEAEISELLVVLDEL